jgi:hypothetical protein
LLIPCSKKAWELELKRESLVVLLNLAEFSHDNIDRSMAGLERRKKAKAAGRNEEVAG